MRNVLYKLDWRNLQFRSNPFQRMKHITFRRNLRNSIFVTIIIFEVFCEFETRAVFCIHQINFCSETHFSTTGKYSTYKSFAGIPVRLYAAKLRFKRFNIFRTNGKKYLLTFSCESNAHKQNRAVKRPQKLIQTKIAARRDGLNVDRVGRFNVST